MHAQTPRPLPHAVPSFVAPYCRPYTHVDAHHQSIECGVVVHDAPKGAVDLGHDGLQARDPHERAHRVLRRTSAARAALCTRPRTLRSSYFVSPARGSIPLLRSSLTMTRPSFFAGHRVPDSSHSRPPNTARPLSEHTRPPRLRRATLTQHVEAKLFVWLYGMQHVYGRVYVKRKIRTRASCQFVETRPP